MTAKSDKPSRSATKAVMRWLTKEVRIYVEAGDSFSVATLESFRKDAIAWLNDKSELKESTIEGADYLEALNYFRAKRNMWQLRENGMEFKEVLHVRTGELVGVMEKTEHGSYNFTSKE